MKPINDRERDQIFASIDTFCDAGRQLAKALATTWLESLDARDEAQGDAARIRSASAQTEPGDKLLTIEQTAAHLQVSSASIRKWIKAEGFPVRWLVDDPRFDLDEVNEWTKRHRKVDARQLKLA